MTRISYGAARATCRLRARRVRRASCGALGGLVLKPRQVDRLPEEATELLPCLFPGAALSNLHPIQEPNLDAQTARGGGSPPRAARQPTNGDDVGEDAAERKQRRVE